MGQKVLDGFTLPPAVRSAAPETVLLREAAAGAAPALPRRRQPRTPRVRPSGAPKALILNTPLPAWSYPVPPTGTNYFQKWKTSSGPKTCDREFRVKDCPDGHERRLFYDGCKLADCAQCKPAATSRRAKKAWAKVGGFDMLSTFVFTIPKDLHALATLAAVNRLRAAAWKILELWLARANPKIDVGNYKAAEVPAFGAVEFTHPAGGCDDDPCTCKRGPCDPAAWAPHLNFIVPMSTCTERLRAAWFGDRGKAELKRLLRLLRRAWRRALSREFGAVAGEVVVHYQYRDKQGKRMHAVRYMARAFPGWSHARLRMRSFGFLADAVLSEKRWEWTGWDKLPPAPRWSQDPGHCSQCGKELVDSGPCDRESAESIRRMERQRRREAG